MDSWKFRAIVISVTETPNFDLNKPYYKWLFNIEMTGISMTYLS